MPTPPVSIRLSLLCAEAGLPAPEDGADVTVYGVTADSRRVREGWLFVALRGMHTDARRYIREALDRGAVAVVTEGGDDRDTADHLAAGTAVLYVPDARLAMAHLFDAWYGHPARRLRLVGVTGTNGKTSVAAMLSHILEGAGVPCGVIGTVGARMTGVGELPSPVGMTTPDPEELYPLLARMAGEHPASAPPLTVVMEVTSHALAFHKVAPLRFAVSVFTNLSPEHLDLHGSMDAYYAVKRRLFEISDVAVVNADGRWGRMLLSETLPVSHWHICHATCNDAPAPDRMCPLGIASCTRVYAEQIAHRGESGVSFKLTTPTARVRIKCPVPGEFTVMNALEASAAALALGVSPTAIRTALAAFGGVKGRMERVYPADHRTVFTASVFIDFAHTPDALENLLEAVHRIRRKDQRIVLVFGCGGDRDPSKRKIMARIASRMADSIIITSDNSRTEDPSSIISDILSGMDKESEFAVIPDRADAIRYAIRYARADDIILLAGKGHETYEIDREGRHPFDERQIVQVAIRDYHSR